LFVVGPASIAMAIMSSSINYYTVNPIDARLYQGRGYRC